MDVCAERMNWSSLTSDLQIEILVRLPVKSLMRFKCVEKSWNILFKTPYFVNKRRRHNSENDKGHSLMIFPRPIDFRPPYITLLSCDGGSADEELVQFSSLFPGNRSILKIESYGNCNGVFFLKAFYWNSTNPGQLILWNPTIKQVHLIPPTPSFCDSKYDDSLYGLCAFNDSNNFKVVRLQHDVVVGKPMLFASGAEVYDLSTQSWTPVHHPPPNRIAVHYNPAYTLFVNYVYYWITTVNLFTISNILCFDFCNNQFHELKAPCIAVEHSFENIVGIKGSLGYVLEYNLPSPIQLEIWIMGQNGWVKQYNIGPVEWTCCRRRFWKDVDQVFGGKVGQLLTSYEDQGNSHSESQTYLLNFDTCSWGREYLESITPLST
ncbi:putative F-box domain-containing protein [Medicago truncatula]|uniref:Putative F-box domain-containing protein n=1 Tax=Medicago truncatula TaxID=3880 RepID=A0A396JLJ9_MEDTR|nr:putative F-box protein At3g23260 [Medicago truncatula]RHN79126.1 putative F-box domain-containing protein [Medicago truncatula]